MLKPSQQNTYSVFVFHHLNEPSDNDREMCALTVMLDMSIVCESKLLAFTLEAINFMMDATSQIHMDMETLQI